jgi:hypothetical protein
MGSLEKAASQVREVGAGFLPRGLEFSATSLHVRFVMYEVAVEHVLFCVSSMFPQLIIISPLPHSSLSPPPEVCDDPDQAAQYHFLSLCVGDSLSDLSQSGEIRNGSLIYEYSLLVVMRAIAQTASYEVTFVTFRFSF